MANELVLMLGPLRHGVLCFKGRKENAVNSWFVEMEVDNHWQFVEPPYAFTIKKNALKRALDLKNIIIHRVRVWNGWGGLDASKPT